MTWSRWWEEEPEGAEAPGTPVVLEIAPQAPQAVDSPLLQPVVVLDTETTGFVGQPWAHVVELGAVTLDEHGRECTEPFSMLMRPPILDARADSALAVNHIERADLLRAPPSAEVAVHFDAWLKASGALRVTAYNNGFDRPMLERMLQLAPGVPRPKWGPCIMLAAHRAMPSGVTRSHAGQGKLPSLREAIAWADASFEGDAHRALTDARAAAAVLRALWRVGSWPAVQEAR